MPYSPIRVTRHSVRSHGRLLLHTVEVIVDDRVGWISVYQVDGRFQTTELEGLLQIAGRQRVVIGLAVKGHARRAWEAAGGDIAEFQRRSRAVPGVAEHDACQRVSVVEESVTPVRQPPRLAVSLVAFFAPPSVREGLLHDFDEKHEANTSLRNVRFADGAYWWDVASTVSSFAIPRLIALSGVDAVFKRLGGS